jgi:GTPase SAR1 family protein
LTVNLWDVTGDKSKFEDFIKLIYEGTNMFIICFNLIDRNSFRSAINYVLIYLNYDYKIVV